MLKRVENGVEIICTPEEEAQIREDWAANERQIALDSIEREKKESLRNKYGDIYESFDKLVQKLGVEL